MSSLLHHILHWFTPHHSNNYRAKLLQNVGIVAVIGVVIGTSIFIRIIEASPLHILGFNSSVTVDEVVSATNRERLAAGLKSLKYSDLLSAAAQKKGANMMEENYWAHNSPSGKSPWVWFNQVGYKYTYAGENLAKDFGSTDRMMAAWMNSPTHKANIVNDKYQEIGVAIMQGNLAGSDTVLVVQLFGASGKTAGEVSPTGQASVEAPISIAAVQGINVKPTIDQYLVKKIVAISSAALFLIALVVDLIIAEDHKLSRRVGKNWGHIIVINVVLLLVAIAQAGSIL